MGLLDKVKATAATATEAAKDAAAKGQAKLDDAQAKKAADGLLRDLGCRFLCNEDGPLDADHRLRDRASRRSAATARVAARADHAGTRVGGRCADGGPSRRRGVRSGTAPASASGRPGVAAPTSADGPDAVGV